MADGINKFVNANLQFSVEASGSTSAVDYNRAVTSLIATVKKTGSNVLQHSSKDKNEDLLGVLSPSEHSIGYLHVMLARVASGKKAVLDNWETISDFLETFDARQIAHDLNTLHILVKAYADAVEKPIHTIRSLRRALIRLQSSIPHTLTPIHTLFVYQCVKSQSYRAALKVINHEVRELPKASGDIFGTSAALQYFYYSGMIYLGLKDWEKAMYQFIACLLPSGQSVSRIQIEAYKKYILAGLLHSGSVPPTPKLVNKGMAKILQTYAKAYEIFADIYETGDSELLMKENPDASVIFEADGNAGLAIQCLASFRKFKIAALRDTYATLSMSLLLQKGEKFITDKTLGRKHQPLEQEMEQIILSMISSGELNATLSQSTDGSSIVRFVEPSSPTQETEAANLAELVAQIADTQALTDLAKATSRRMGLEKEFINQSNKQRGHGGPMFAQTHVGGYLKEFAQGDPMEDVFYVEEGDDMVDHDDF